MSGTVTGNVLLFPVYRLEHYKINGSTEVRIHAVKLKRVVPVCVWPLLPARSGIVPRTSQVHRSRLLH